MKIVITKLKQLWCQFIYDHKGCEKIGRTTYRCKSCGKGFNIGLPPCADEALQVKPGEVLVVVHGLTGSGKSAVAGEIEILCKALGLEVRWENGDEEKFLTHADWTAALELYKPRVRIVEINTPRPASRGTDIAKDQP